MRTIYKYELELTDQCQNLLMPKNSVHCFVGLSPASGKVSVWFLIPDSNAKPVQRVFLVRGTGHSISPYEIYVGSVISGEFVWHVFEAGL